MDLTCWRDTLEQHFSCIWYKLYFVQLLHTKETSRRTFCEIICCIQCEYHILSCRFHLHSSDPAQCCHLASFKACSKAFPNHAMGMYISCCALKTPQIKNEKVLDKTNLKSARSFSSVLKPFILRNWQGSLHISNAWKALVMEWMIGKRILS
jgi:hypothetical protein